ncbi:MAG: hypothetical protein GX596_13565 [Propionibacterium sp.]|nr:hypothetical protein [Propionibacterium sp.]
MFKPTPAVVAALRGLVPDDDLDAALAPSRPDLTDVLLQAAARHRDLPRTLEAAAVRAACARLGERHGGHTIEVRVPPYAATQLGFGTGPRHTRGTPPNVVEMDATTFLDLATGRVYFADADVRASGAQAGDVARVFPLA